MQSTITWSTTNDPTKSPLVHKTMTLNDAIHPAIPYPTSFHVDSVNGVPLLSTLHMTSDIIAIPTYSPSDALALVAQLAFTMGAAGAYRSCDSLKACRSFCRGAAASTVNRPAPGRAQASCMLSLQQWKRSARPRGVELVSSLLSSGPSVTCADLMLLLGDPASQ